MFRKKIKSIIGGLIGVCLLLSACSVKPSSVVTENADGVYTPTQDLKITIWNTQGTDFTRAQTLSNNVVVNWLTGQTKVSIENIYGNDGGQWDTKLYRLIAGNNLPEVVVCGAGQGPAHFAKLAEAKKIWEIDMATLEKYAPNVVKRVPADMLERFKINGKLSGIPIVFSSDEKTQPDMKAEQLAKIKEKTIKSASDETAGIWIRDDIAKQLFPKAKTWDEICKLIEERQEPIGDELFDIPINTTEDYIKLMQDIKKLNMTVNGKPVYSFGYDGGDNWTALSYLGADMMGYASHNYTASWNPTTRKMRVPLVEPLIKEAAKIQNKLILDKVIDPESLVHTSSMYKEKVLNGQYAIVGIGSAGGAQVVNTQLKETGKPFRYRPLYSSVPNKDEYKAGKQPLLWSSSIGFLKTLSEAELIQMLNWVNVCFSDKYEEVYWWGPKEAGLYTETADGKREYTDPRFTARYINGNSSALPAQETKGIGTTMSVGTYHVMAVSDQQSRWAPIVYNNLFVLTPYNYSLKAISFKETSKHVADLELFPPSEAWSPEFAEIPEVVKYWGNREQWEQPFKIALSAGTQEEFDKKWEDAIVSLNKIVDVKTMCDKMTEVLNAKKTN